jgi:hypothetical protein
MGSVSDTIHCREKDASSAQITVLIIYGLLSPLKHCGYLTISHSFTNIKKVTLSLGTARRYAEGQEAQLHSYYLATRWR